MKKMQIFEPAMCCNSGFSGVGMDSELMRISAALKMLLKNGIVVDRFNLSTEPQEFIENKLVNDFINTKGIDDLPVTVLDGEIVITGRYPTNEEFIKLLGVPATFLGEQAMVVKATANRSEGCDCFGGKCC